ncbi:hypothetical protein CRYUN_Cryun12cG0059800 [Craigia yunnanensis]
MITSLLVAILFLISTIFSHSKALRFPQELYNLSSNQIFIVDNPSRPPSSSASPTPLLWPTSSAVSSPLVPALFIIGDSTVDCGNNNFLGTFACADRPPYGREFDTHLPTGRFCNGRIPVDYLVFQNVSIASWTSLRAKLSWTSGKTLLGDRFYGSDNTQLKWS